MRFTQIIRDLRENVDSFEELFNRLLVVNNKNTTDINEAKQLLVSANLCSVQPWLQFSNCRTSRC